MYRLIAGGDKTARSTFIYEEFFRQSYFSRDMEELLKKIEAKINRADE
jgi:hypothetical protein